MRFAIAIVLLLFFAVAGVCQEEEPTIPPEAEALRIEEVVDQCREEGIKLLGVARKLDGTFEIRCQGGSEARARAILEEVMSVEPPGQTPVETFHDAVAVIQFEPGNVQARELLKKHYKQLRKAHVAKLKAGGK